MASKRSRSDEGAADSKAARPKKEENVYGKGLVDWLNSAVSSYHCCEEGRRRLLAAGFQQIQEKNEWNLQPGQRLVPEPV